MSDSVQERSDIDDLRSQIEFWRKMANRRDIRMSYFGEYMRAMTYGTAAWIGLSIIMVLSMVVILWLGVRYQNNMDQTKSELDECRSACQHCVEQQ